MLCESEWLPPSKTKKGDTIVSVKSRLFIDANQYLKLYQMVGAKTILAALEEQQNYIFVTKQIVDEVCREKVRVFTRNKTGDA
jgi:hypothetical protein